MGQARNVDKNFPGKPEGNLPLGRSTRKWEDNIRTDLR